MNYSTLEIVAICITAPICFGLWGVLVFACVFASGKQKENASK